ncbi:MAG: hypothetical protein ACP6IU_09395 [Candidatus Asgardarchaeia archaeon]
MSKPVQDLSRVERMLSSKKERRLASLVLIRLANQLGISVDDLLGYFAWRNRIEELKKSKRITKEDGDIALKELEQSGISISDEELQTLLDKVNQELEKWKKIEEKLKQIGIA